MVGGKVIGLARRGDYTLVHVQDKHDQCSVRVEEKKVKDGSRVSIEIGDSIWWQSGNAMWTPKENVKPSGSGQRCGVDFDIRLLKIGYSH